MPFDIEKNNKRKLFFADISRILGKKKGKCGEFFFEYAGQPMKVVFISYEIPFTEEYNGDFKLRKGYTIAGVYDDLTQKNPPVSIGFSVCSEKDEWSINRGVLNAFVDAINVLSYQDKKACIEDTWGELLENADKNMVEGMF